MATRLGKISGVALATFLSLKSIQTISQRRKDLLLAKEEQDDLQLVHVQVAFRHGARTPIFCPLPKMKNFNHEAILWEKNVLLGDLQHTVIKYRVKSMDGGKRPDSVYDKKQQNHTWPGGAEQGVLTKVGQQQMYELGQRLHQRYITDNQFLQPVMIPQEVYVRTSNIERTILSARCVLAGLYGQENINGVVTMVTHPEKDETIYPNVVCCPALQKWAKMAMRSDTLVSTEYKKNLLLVKEELGITKEKFVFVYLRDFLAAQEAHNFPIPPAVLKHKKVIDKHALEELLSVQCGHPHGRHEVLRLGVGKLLEDVVDRMKDKISQKSPAQHKLCMYSVHDTTLVCLMVSLGLKVEKWVDFAADLTLELYKSKNEEYFVKVLLQGKEQLLPGANSTIYPFEKFRKLASSYSVGDWHEECNQTHH